MLTPLLMKMVAAAIPPPSGYSRLYDGRPAQVPYNGQLGGRPTYNEVRCCTKFKLEETRKLQIQFQEQEAATFEQAWVEDPAAAAKMKLDTETKSHIEYQGRLRVELKDEFTKGKSNEFSMEHVRRHWKQHPFKYDALALDDGGLSKDDCGFDKKHPRGSLPFDRPEDQRKWDAFSRQMKSLRSTRKS
eukprot:SAG11_NODE_477_length_9118_cov_3.513582_3_plen_188_part_00